ncbi:hypothetical protein HA402_004836 [Bradysia odoriphaga]|nr:hypothetical protein HA402_004836 [Bradysia odoriphaga]
MMILLALADFHHKMTSYNHVHQQRIRVKFLRSYFNFAFKETGCMVFQQERHSYASVDEVNGIKNFQGRTLDLVFTSDPNDTSVQLSDSSFVNVDVYHPPLDIEFSVDFDDVAVSESDDRELNFRRADFVGLNACLESISWDAELNASTDVDSMVDRFYELLSVGFERYVPIRKKISNAHPPWYSKNLLNLKNRRNRAHKKFKDRGDTASYVKFCSLRNEFDASQSRAYRIYLDKTQENLVTNPSSFWKYVNSMKKTTGYPSLMRRGDRRTTTAEGKCDFFAEFFRDVFVNEQTPGNRTFGLRKCVDIGSLSVSEEQLLGALEGIDTSKGDVFQVVGKIRMSFPYSRADLDRMLSAIVVLRYCRRLASFLSL